MNITIDLSATQELAISYAESDYTFLVQSMTIGRANQAIKEIISKTVEHCIANNVQIPATEEDIVAYAFDNGIVKTAEQRNAEAALQQPV